MPKAAINPNFEQMKTDAFESDFWKENAAPGRITAGFRLKHQLTQAQLAELTGIEQADIAALEDGKLPLTSQIAARIGIALEENPEKFFRHCHTQENQ